MKYTTVINNQTIPVSQIPEISYADFFEVNAGFISERSENHCVNYFGFPAGNKIKLICCIADDANHVIYISSCLVSATDQLASLSAKILAFEKFEREIHENFGIDFPGHPWLKPLRYPHNRKDKSQTIANYPFFSIQSEELHEVGVGPIHAGVIEPGHFRFICNGEQVLHLEIQLGYQHRGIESLFLEKKKLAERVQIAESIAGDTVIGHSVAFASVWESLCGYTTTDAIDFSRTMALELERMAIHTGDLSAACADVAYQMGNAVFGRLRTPIVNFFQEWCGNRLAKGLIRPAQNQFPFTPYLAQRLHEVLNTYEPEFNEMNAELFKMPSALSRFERTGTVSLENTMSIGSVGMAARSSGLNRDIRASHPHARYPDLKHEPIVKRHGDVYSRLQVRKQEVPQSISYLRDLMARLPDYDEAPLHMGLPAPDSFAISLVEGWRGEICHAAVTGSNGNLLIYKVKDPSFHNWMALAMAVRNNEISDFPICNKSFNLSYCGHDL
jgi:Ni,Fe-hydrogenase III large subunit